MSNAKVASCLSMVFVALAPSMAVTPAQATDTTNSDISKSPERLTRCGCRTRIALDGREDREAVCVFQDDVGSYWLITTRVFCDEGCRPIGSPVLTEFYE